MALYRTDGHRPMQHSAKSVGEFIEACRAFMRMRRLSLATEKSYLHYIGRFLEFHGRKRPETMGEAEVEAFLTHLVVGEGIAKSTQNVAFSALLFLYREVLGIELQGVDALRSQRPKRVPVVLSKSEVSRVLGQLEGQSLLIASILYGAGLRLFEGQRLRVKDVDFETGKLPFERRVGDSCWQRRPGSSRGFAAKPIPPAFRSSERVADALGSRAKRESAPGFDARCARQKVSRRGFRVDLAICFSGSQGFG